MVNFSAQRNRRFYTQETFLALISVRGLVDAMSIVWPEVLSQWKIQMSPSGIEPATFLIMTLWLTQLRYLWINCTIRKEITYSCATEIGIAVFTGPTIDSVLRLISAGYQFICIYLKSILILSSLLGMFPSSSVLCSTYSGKGLFAYFVNCHACHWFCPLSSIQPNVLLDTPRHWVTVFRNFRW